MNQDERFLAIISIVERAERMGIAQGDRITCVMDIDFADRQFGLRLKDMLNGEDFDFVHDFTGIQATMNRDTCRIEGLFVPRFAR